MRCLGDINNIAYFSMQRVLILSFASNLCPLQVLFATPHVDVVPFLAPVFVLSLRKLAHTGKDSGMKFTAELRWNSKETLKPKLTFRTESRINLQPIEGSGKKALAAENWECPPQLAAVRAFSVVLGVIPPCWWFVALVVTVVVSVVLSNFLEKRQRKERRKGKPKRRRLAKSTRRERFSAVSRAIQARRVLGVRFRWLVGRDLHCSNI